MKDIRAKGQGISVDVRNTAIKRGKAIRVTVRAQLEIEPDPGLGPAELGLKIREILDGKIGETLARAYPVPAVIRGKVIDGQIQDVAGIPARIPDGRIIEQFLTYGFSREVADTVRTMWPNDQEYGRPEISWQAGLGKSATPPRVTDAATAEAMEKFLAEAPAGSVHYPGTVVRPGPGIPANIAHSMPGPDDSETVRVPVRIEDESHRSGADAREK